MMYVYLHIGTICWGIRPAPRGAGVAGKSEVFVHSDNTARGLSDELSTGNGDESSVFLLHQVVWAGCRALFQCGVSA